MIFSGLATGRISRPSAGLNYQEFQAAGVKEVVVSCPECYQVLNQFMPEVIPGMDLKVTLLLDLLRREVHKGGITFKAAEAPGHVPGPLPAGPVGRLLRDPAVLDSDDPGTRSQGNEELGPERGLLRQ